jgi:hypothetical protein
MGLMEVRFDQVDRCDSAASTLRLRIIVPLEACTHVMSSIPLSVLYFVGPFSRQGESPMSMHKVPQPDNLSATLDFYRQLTISQECTAFLDE